jgi:hypothetical protein
MTSVPALKIKTDKCPGIKKLVFDFSTKAK